jgi:hypothetical protein
MPGDAGHLIGGAELHRWWKGSCAGRDHGGAAGMARAHDEGAECCRGKVAAATRDASTRRGMVSRDMEGGRDNSCGGAAGTPPRAHLTERPEVGWDCAERGCGRDCRG